jgi:Family of unknown function (DUF6151)
MTDRLDLPFACACGEVAGWIARAGPTEGDHVICHCTDCQYFATHLAAGRRVLDAAGGTSLFQSRCARMHLSSGRDKLACIHLTEKPTLRWYATCCSTPMFNTYANGRVPYLSTLTANCDRARRDGLLGPAIGHLFTKDAIADPGDVPRMSMAKLMRRFFRRLLQDLASGDRRRSALFDSVTLEPIAKPYRLLDRNNSERASQV